jgi:hypothetical protein
MCDSELNEAQLEELRRLRDEQKPHHGARWSSAADAAYAAQVGHATEDNAVTTATSTATFR